jgi:hypothetical protein
VNLARAKKESVAMLTESIKCALLGIKCPNEYDLMAERIAKDYQIVNK